MSTADLLTRLAAGISLFATLYNMLMSLIWFAAMVIIVIGCCWAVVGMVLLVELVLIIAAFVTGFRPWVLVIPVIGIICSLSNFNFPSLVLEIVSMVMMVVAMTLPRDADPQA